MLFSASQSSALHDQAETAQYSLFDAFSSREPVSTSLENAIEASHDSMVAG
jgi:hypothetical protein